MTFPIASRSGFCASLTLAAATALLAFTSSLIGAFAAAPEQGALATCGQDLAKFCRGIEAGGGKKVRCLMDNRTSLSPECNGALGARQAQRDGGTTLAQAQPPATSAPLTPAPSGTGQPPGTLAPPAAASRDAALPKASPLKANMRACRTDAVTFCGSVEKGGGRKVKCLVENQAKLSPECASAISSVQAQKQANKQTCAVDIATLCPAARGPARLQCLDANKAQLSPACADQLAARAAKREKRAAAPPKQ